MTTRTPCLAAEGLKRFLSDGLTARELEAVARHVEECAACADKLDALLKNDTLLAAARSGTVVDDGPEADAVHRLTERLRQLTVEATRETPQRFDFLSAAEQPDEIGRLGGYRVLKVLGQGGMGCVFHAEDPRLKRPIALKVMKPDMATRPGAKQRFLREAQAAAAVSHDHVVTIYQVGEDRDIPFLAMQFLQGTSLDDWLKRSRRPTTAQLLRIGREIASGLAAAHAKGLIHRDVKPGNIWLEAPTGRVKLLDFGLARAVEDDLKLTQSGAIVGTPAYMAPEQAMGQPVDHRTDLFSLGCVLYRLAAGRTPFVGDSPVSILTSLVAEHPPLVQDLNPSVHGPVAELIMRLLDKDPAQRPASATEVARQLQALERSLTISAPVAVPVADKPPKPTPAPARRRQLSPGIVAAAVVLGLIGVGGWFYGATIYRVATNQGELVVEVDSPDIEVEVRQDGAVVVDRSSQRRFVLTAVEGEVAVAEKDGVHLLTKKFTLKRGGQTTVTVTLQELADARRKQPGTLDHFARADVSPYELKIAGWGATAGNVLEVVAVLGESRLKHRDGFFGVSWSSDGKYLAGCSSSVPGYVWEAATGFEAARIEGLMPNGVVAFQPGRSDTLAVSVQGKNRESGLVIIEALTGNKLGELLGHGKQVRGVAWSHDGKLLASADGDGLILVRTVEGQELFRVQGVAGQFTPVAFNRDGSRLALPGSDGQVKVWDVSANREAAGPKGRVDTVSNVAFSPDGRLLAAAGDAGQLKVWDAATGLEVKSFAAIGFSMAIAFSPDGRWLAAAANNPTVLVWDTQGWRKTELPTKGEVVRGLAFSPDSQRLATSQSIGFVQVWDLSSGKEAVPATGHAGSVKGVAVGPDGQTIASCGNDGTLRLWDAQGRDRVLFDHGRKLTGVAFSPDGNALATCDEAGVVQVWDQTKKGMRFKVADHASMVHAVAFSPNGKRLASASRDQTVRVYDAQTGKVTHKLEGHGGEVVGVAFSPDGQLLASGGHEATARVWDLATGKVVLKLTHPLQVVRSLAFSPDGRQLLTAGGEHMPRLWDLATGKEAVTFGPVHKSDASLAAFLPNGRAIVTCDGTNKLVAWEAATGKVLRQIQLGTHIYVRDLAVAPDGRHVVTANGNGTLYVLRLEDPPGGAKVSPRSQAWLARVRALKPAEQMAAVAEELKRRNPGLAKEIESEPAADGTIGFVTLKGNIEDLWPLQALPNLNRLACWGTSRHDPHLDLAALKGLPIKILSLVNCDVTDLSPLEGMAINQLVLAKTNVSDLTPLKGKPVTYLNLQDTPVTDLTPLAAAPLQALMLDVKPYKGLEVVKRLKTLDGINNKPAADFWKEYEAQFGPPR